MSDSFVSCKRCPQCDEMKPRSAFASNRSAKDNLQSYCRLCNAANCRAFSIKYKYGLSLEDYEGMLWVQDNRCLGCEREFCKEIPSNVDHDHACCPGSRSCGRCVRGLICRKCNLSLGHADDSIERLEALLHYLKSAPKEMSLV